MFVGGVLGVNAYRIARALDEIGCFRILRGFTPGSRATFVSAKVAKTIDAPSGHMGGEGRQPFEERPNSPGSDKVRNG